MLYYNLTLCMPPTQLISNLLHQSEFFSLFPHDFTIEFPHSSNAFLIITTLHLIYALVFIPCDSIIPHYPARQFPAAATNHAG
jgi:hypothetical protein